MVTRNKPGSQNWLPGTNLGAKIGYLEQTWEPKLVTRKVSGKCQECLLKVSGRCLIVSTSCLVGVWTYLDCVWTMSRLYLEHKTCLESVWNCLECVWMCLEHVWTVSRLCLEHVHTFCGPCPEHVRTVTGPWCPCLDHELCMCMDQFGPCLNRVLTLL